MEERDSDLNEEEYIIMEDSREEQATVRVRFMP